jgi:UPF0176 protein
MNAAIANIAVYRFVRIEDPGVWCVALREWCAAAGLKGTILLAGEGINAFLAGRRQDIEAVLDRIRALPGMEGLEPRWSFSGTVPFNRLRVRVKPEIVTLRRSGFDRTASPARAISPRTLCRWLDTGYDDEGQRFSLVDTRNAWEFRMGSFQGAMDAGIGRFSEFGDRLDRFSHLRDQTIVTYCTGGIRCEKAAPLMQAVGFRRVHQLEGGILGWFEACGGAHWQGDCAVFDGREALRPDLTPRVEVLPPRCDTGTMQSPPATAVPCLEMRCPY